MTAMRTRLATALRVPTAVLVVGVAAVTSLALGACHTSAPPALDLAAPGRPSVSIAFRRGGDIYLLDGRTATERRLTEGGQYAAPWWTSDGAVLFFERAGAGTR